MIEREYIYKLTEVYTKFANSKSAHMTFRCTSKKQVLEILKLREPSISYTYILEKLKDNCDEYETIMSKKIVTEEDEKQIIGITKRILKSL